MLLRVVLGCAALALGWPSGSLAQQAAHARTPLSAELNRAIGPVGIFDEVIVEVEGRTAVLTGRVTSEQKKAEVGARAARVPGIASVRNEIGVLPPSREDDELRQRIARSVYGHPAFWSHASRPDPPIHIIVERGHVTLTGTVDSPAENALARSLASGLGEQSVSTRLRVRERADRPPLSR